MKYEGQIAETVCLTGHQGDRIDAYFARPLGGGPFPGIVVIHHMPGWDEWIKEVPRKLAYHGFACIAPHLYFRDGPGDPDDIGGDEIAGEEKRAELSACQSCGEEHVGNQRRREARPHRIGSVDAAETGAATTCNARTRRNEHLAPTASSQRLMRWSKVAPCGGAEAWPRRHRSHGADRILQPLRLGRVRGEARGGTAGHDVGQLHRGARCVIHHRGEFGVQ